MHGAANGLIRESLVVIKFFFCLEVEKNFFFGQQKNKGLGDEGQTTSAGTHLVPSAGQCLYVPGRIQWFGR